MWWEKGDAEPCEGLLLLAEFWNLMDRVGAIAILVEEFQEGLHPIHQYAEETTVDPGEYIKHLVELPLPYYQYP